jgi:hypothetical protein
MSDRTTEVLRDSMRVMVEMAPESPDLPMVPAPKSSPLHSPIFITSVTFAAIVLVVGLGVLLIGGGAPIGEDLAIEESVIPTLTWSRLAPDDAVFGGEGDEAFLGITAGGPGLVAVGTVNEDAAVWTSQDGIEWSRVSHDVAVFGGDEALLDGSEDGYQQIESVTEGGPGLVAVGLRFDEPDLYGLHAAVWTSVDGITWEAVPDQTAFDTHDPDEFGNGKTLMHSVTVGGPGLVAVGSDAWSAAVWTSPDGVTWTRVPHDPDVFGEGLAGDSERGPQTEMYSVTVGGPGLVAVGSAGPSPTWINRELVEPGAGQSWSNAAVWTSPDGLNWTRVPHDEAIFGGPGNQVMSSVTAGDFGLVAVGFDEPDAIAAMGGARAAVWTSPDGITWNRIPHDEAIFGGVAGDEQTMSRVIAGGPGLVAVGGTIWTSPDGALWTRIVNSEALFEGLLDPQMTDIALGGPGLVAVGSHEMRWTQWGSIRNAAAWTATISYPE